MNYLDSPRTVSVRYCGIGADPPFRMSRPLSSAFASSGCHCPRRTTTAFFRPKQLPSLRLSRRCLFCEVQPDVPAHSSVFAHRSERAEFATPERPETTSPCFVVFTSVRGCPDSPLTTSPDLRVALFCLSGRSTQGLAWCPYRARCISLLPMPTAKAADLHSAECQQARNTHTGPNNQLIDHAGTSSGWPFSLSV